MRDPVCRMYVDADTAGIKSEYKGKTYCFCSESCKQAFDANPEKYAAMSHEGAGCCS